jgi:hypothetical protein
MYAMQVALCSRAGWCDYHRTVWLNTTTRAELGPDWRRECKWVRLRLRLSGSSVVKRRWTRPRARRARASASASARARSEEERETEGQNVTTESRQTVSSWGDSTSYHLRSVIRRNVFLCLLVCLLACLFVYSFIAHTLFYTQFRSLQMLQIDRYRQRDSI